MDKETIAHDLALIVVENMLEDIDEDYRVSRYATEVVEIYKQAFELIVKHLEEES